MYAAVCLAFVIAAVSAVAAQPSWTNSKWGPQDEIGAANLISPASVLRAASLIRTGKTYSLGIIIDANTPSFPPRTLSLTVLQPEQAGRPGIKGLGENRFTFNDDILFAWLGTGSQIDGLGHVGIGPWLYNGFNRTQVAKTTGLTKLGLEKLPPLVARGVVLDMAAFFGVDIVPEGTAYTREDILKAAREQGVEFRKGDVVLFHSGWLSLLHGENSDKQRFISGAPGLGISGARHLLQVGVVAVGGDTFAMEATPSENEDEFFPVHSLLLPRNGVFILEVIDTRELIKDNVQEFMFVLGVTRIRGAVQMMINPTAIS